jgi:DNA-binding NarL/FixJ family response regulator
MGNPAGVRRDFAALEERRMEAARLLRAGLSQSEVARELEQSGARGLRKAKQVGRPARLTV